jgi:predicted transposase/invertase (TIGR01784 family)
MAEQKTRRRIRKLSREEARAKISPTQDLFVRWLFGEETHVELTKSFINAVLEDAEQPLVKELRIKSPFIMSECRSTKMPVTDIEAADETGTTYDIEIQTYTENAFLLRLKYYWAGIFRRQLKRGTNYADLKPCIVIALMTKKLFTNSSGIHHISLTVDRYDRSLAFFTPSDPEEYHIIELEQFENNAEALYTVSEDGTKRTLAPSLFSWLRFMKNGAEEDFMKKYRETNTAVAEAKRHYETFIDDDALAIAQLRRDRADHDLAQFKHDAIEEGHAEGLAEGRAEVQTEIAKKLRAAGMSIDETVKLTGLSAEDIVKL